jgi:hypothetical protein
MLRLLLTHKSRFLDLLAGRRSPQVCHWVGKDYRCVDYYNPVDGDEVPVPHAGLALTVDEFHALAARVAGAGVEFLIEPHLRFAGMPGEQVSVGTRTTYMRKHTCVSACMHGGLTTCLTPRCSIPCSSKTVRATTLSSRP